MDTKFLQQPINFYLSDEYHCSYLPKRQANSLFVDPRRQMTADLYSKLIQQGYRRSGNSVYTPYCKSCHDCVPVRLDVKKFTLSRSQKRCRNKNKAIQFIATEAIYNPQQYQIYAQYVTSRHIGGGMDNPTNDAYLDFLTSTWSHTTFFELRENNQLIGVSVTDIVKEGLSAVYTFFDPSEIYQKRSLGVYAVLWQAEEAHRRGLKWLYLGYWIKNCNKMNYKDKYQPLEYYYDHHWHHIPPETSII
jgi:arginine-tRNA-protein transferase